MKSKAESFAESEEEMIFDDLLKILGELGRFQKIRLFLICLFGTVCAFHAMNMVFVGAKPKFDCEVSPINMSNVIYGNTTENDIHKFLRSPGKCEIYDQNVTLGLLLSGVHSLQSIKVNNASIIKRECKSWVYSRDVYGPTIVTQFDLVCENDWLRSTSKTLYFFGRLLGAVIFGQLSDIFGRKPMLFVNLFLLMIAGCVASASPSFFVFIPFYILQGASQTGLFLVAYTMGTELVGPSYRLHAGFLVQSAYSVGFMALAIVAYVIRDWRYIELAITLPVLLFIPYYWLLPESVRWLLSKNQTKKAENIIQKVAKTNNVEISQETLEKMTKVSEKQGESETEKKYTFVDLLRPSMLLLSLNVWFNWLVNAMVYYGLTLGTDNLGGDPYINFCIAGAVEIPAYVICMLVLNPFGRKKPLLISMVLGGMACIASGFIDHVVVKVALAMVGKFCITASYAIIYLMAAEVFPTVVRNIGMGVSSMCARIGGMLAPQILELSRFWAPLPLILFGGLAFLAGALVMFLPETSGRPLPQTIEDAIARGTNSKGVELETMPEYNDKKTNNAAV